ncbi:MAG: 4-hydroxy-3-methylbut-2-enyl diphosphate reductase, partial [Sphingomonadales bacterium]
LLIQRAGEVDFAWLDGVRTLGITAGASAPEFLVRELVDRLATRFDVHEQEVESTTEDMLFKLPRTLVA